MAADLFSARKQNMILDVEHAGGRVCPLDILAQLKEIPAFAVDHRRIGGSLKGMQLVDETAIKIDRTILKVRPGHAIAQIEKGAIELLPHLARNLFTNGAGIFSGRARYRR